MAGENADVTFLMPTFIDEFAVKLIEVCVFRDIRANVKGIRQRIQPPTVVKVEKDDEISVRDPRQNSAIWTFKTIKHLIH